MLKKGAPGLLAGVAVLCIPQVAHGQATPAATATTASEAPASTAGLADIVVTAQKREQSINSVGMAIQAASGERLITLGITDPKDLEKIVPGFTATTTAYTTPVYTLRGIGLYDSAFMSAPSVAVYVDQIPRNYPVMSYGVGLDVQRVEVLKGPQGTLFGQSATGGAVNYIPNKPTDHVEAGGTATYERFGKVDVQGFVSGPITDTLRMRLAAQGINGGAWQIRNSDRDQKNGKTDTIDARLLTDWQPTSKLKFEFGMTGRRDRSDSLAGQLTRNNLNVYGSQAAVAASGNPYGYVDETTFNRIYNPASAGFDASAAAHQAAVVARTMLAVTDQQSYLEKQGAIDYLSTPVIPDGHARLAEWARDWKNDRNNTFYQFTGRMDWNLADDLTLTSISAYAHQKVNEFFTEDATLAHGLADRLYGTLKTFNQEVRVAYDTPAVHAIVGANYDFARSNDNTYFGIRDLSINTTLDGNVFGDVTEQIQQTKRSYAGFANVEYKATDKLTFNGGVRYTENDLKAANCNYDGDVNGTPTSTQYLSNLFGTSRIVPGFGAAVGNPNSDYFDLQTIFGVSAANHKVVGPGQCYALLPDFTPTVTPFVQKLDQHNWSWRAAVDYKLDGGTLLYASVTRGYKMGIFASTSPSATYQYAPATQEKVIAYETGFKAPLFDRRLQLNGGVFYYDYSDKQVRVRVADAIFGLLEKLVNVPKSYVYGAELEAHAAPVEGLLLSASGTYLKSKVTSNFATATTPQGQVLNVYSQAGYRGNFKGSELPFTPHFSANADIGYDWQLSNGLKPFVGASMNYQGKKNATFHTSALPADDYEFKAYMTVDLRVGVAAENDSWRVSLFGRNVFNKYYNTTIFQGIDTLYRYAGMPVTYGITVSVKTR